MRNRVVLSLPRLILSTMAIVACVSATGRWDSLPHPARATFATCDEVHPICHEVNNVERSSCLQRSKAAYAALAGSDQTKWLVERGCPLRVADPQLYVGAGEVDGGPVVIGPSGVLPGPNAD